MTLTVSNLRKSFGGIHATREVSFEVSSGETLGIIGANGAGKSTLFDLISGAVRPDAGEVLLDGVRLTGRTPAAICARGVARTFQKLRPFAEMTTVENVMVGAFLHERSAKTARIAAMDQLERVGLAHRAEVRAGGLSTGQRKRLELARVLSTGARTLLLDEVTGGVDPGARAGLARLVEELRGDGLTIVLIEHNMSIMRQLADRVLALHLGAVLTIGTPDEVMASPEVQAAYLGTEEGTP